MQNLFLILGKSGSGKTTVADYMVKHNLDVAEHYSMGNEFRKIARNDKEIAKYVFTGKRVPDDIAKKMLKIIIKKFSKNIILLDGFPRDYKQTELLELLLKTYNINLKNVFEIDIADNIAKQRVLNRARGSDVNSTVFNNRLDDYNQQMIKIREHYSRLIIKINGNQDVKIIADTIEKYLLGGTN